MPPSSIFKALPFSSEFDFACQDGYYSNMQILLKIGYKTLPLPIVAKNSILNVTEFLYLSLKTSPYTKATPVLCENQSFFLLFWNVAIFIEIHCVFLCYFLQHDEVFFISLLAGCYHYLVFLDSINCYSKSKLLVKE